MLLQQEQHVNKYHKSNNKNKFRKFRFKKKKKQALEKSGNVFRVKFPTAGHKWWSKFRIDRGITLM